MGVTVAISWFWQAFFFLLLVLPLMTVAFGYGNVRLAWAWLVLGFFFLISMGLLPAVMLRQGVTEGRPARILIWVFTIGSQAIMCVLFLIIKFHILGGNQ